MATNVPGNIRFNKIIQKRIVDYANQILVEHKKTTQMQDKMEMIDKAYARYKESGDCTDDGVDARTSCNALGDDNVIAPIVVSQVDSMVAYLADVFLSGFPLFPVVSTASNLKWAEQLESIIDDHAVLGGYPRQLMLFFRDCAKYNFGAVEGDWTSITQFSVGDDFQNVAGRSVKRTAKKYTELRRLDPYNTIYDRTINPGDVSLHGDYAGDIRIISRIKLKKILNRLSQEEKQYNIEQALTSTGLDGYYRAPPTVSEYISVENPHTGINWHKYMTGRDESVVSGSNNYEYIRLYIRIIPSDFGMPVPQPNTPQIYRVELVNGILVGMERIVSAYDALPVFFGQPIEDGLGYQTKSIAEGEIPIQEAVTKLLNIRFSAARRAVGDRALYDPDLISPSDINAPVAAPKIPVRGSIMKDKTLDSAYKSIPFTPQGLESVMQDAATLVEMSKTLSGLNAPMQGQFQKGNKSVQEWNDTMAGSDNRLRLPALTLAIQFFGPLKEFIKLNIFQYGDDAKIPSQATGQVHEINMQELRKQVLTFRLSDGLTPKSKMVAFDMLNAGMNMISQSQILQMAYGAMLPKMFAFMMNAGGVKGLDQFSPEVPAGTAPTNLNTNDPQTLAAPGPQAVLPAA
jgi:hypothetical protein